MQQPGRKFSAGSGYRYGFNGKENDNEVKGEGNQQDYGMRIYDPRIGKFLSFDPLSKDYPWYTPYQFSGNNPILYVDLDGAEPVLPKNQLKSIALVHNEIEKGSIITGYFNPKDSKELVTVEKVYDKIKDQCYFIHKSGGTNYYWESEQNSLKVHFKANGMVEANGKWVKYEDHDQRRARIGNGGADILGIGMFGIAVGVAAAPVLSWLGGAPLIGPGAISAPNAGLLVRGFAGGIGDAAGQLATNGGSFKDLNWYSIGANFGGGVIGLNSFTTEATASMLGRDGTFNSPTNIVTNTIIGGSLGGLIGSKNAPFSPESFSRVFDKKVANAASTIPEFWSSSIENSLPQEKEKE